jgi:S1-C subfamily serine protease
MTETDPLAALSDSLAALVAARAASAVALDWGGNRPISAIAWRPGVLVTSEQSLPRAAGYFAIRQDGERVAATLAGRDATTNVAVLRVEGGADPVPPSLPRGAGALVMALGREIHGGTIARLAAIELLGPAWDSQAGGRIDHLIRLGLRLPPAAEGGPVFDTRGLLLGMSTFGPRRSVLVIPVATIGRVVEPLLAHGRIARGWLGVMLHPVALPREMQERAGAGSGLMVIGLAENAPAASLLLQGDILLAIDGIALATPRAAAIALGPDSVGRALPVRVLRGGVVTTLTITIAARPA